MSKEIISTDKAPAAIGPYSQAVRFGDLLFVSGTLPLDPEAGTIVPGRITEQAEQALCNLKTVIEESGGSLAGVLKTTCYLASFADFPEFNAVYATYFDTEPPARETVEVSALPKDALVEISAICGIG